MIEMRPYYGGIAVVLAAMAVATCPEPRVVTLIFFLGAIGCWYKAWLKEND
jgi:hypothetical protein